MIDFRCPRCGTPAHERFFGPCAGCRADLNDRIGVAAGPEGEPPPLPASSGRFEPAMHVVPNHVATKD